VVSPEDSAVELAHRLRTLRRRQWPGQGITQQQLADALKGDGTLSVPLISSWESTSKPETPPEWRLETYARFFATPRSVEQPPYRLLELEELTDDERAARDRLLDELKGLRHAAKGTTSASDQDASGLLRFPPGEDVAIVCAPLPPEMRADNPYSDPGNADYDELYNYTDLGALVALYGQIRALNPGNEVDLRLSNKLEPGDYTSHLVLLGGVDWNDATRDLFQQRIGLPVRQVARDDSDDVGWFEADTEDGTVKFEPQLQETAGQREVVEDVAHFYRGPSPYNQERTVLSFNGMYASGTLGAVRALTDGRFCDRNESYVQERLPGYDAQWSLLMRVKIVNRQVVPPDWTDRVTRLHEWSAVGIDGSQGRDT
jgi:hypothetical protein